jgi:predicted XRE-type DNA-binding protein
MPKNEPADVFKVYRLGTEHECWPYVGRAWGGQAREKRPYFMAAGRRQIAYRWIYELVNGVELTPDQMILHSCDKGGWPVGCGNPKHMRIGNVRENSDDMMQRERHGLPRSVVNAIRTLLSQGREQKEIAALYGVSRESISAIATGRVYKKRTDHDGPKYASRGTEEES